MRALLFLLALALAAPAFAEDKTETLDQGKRERHYIIHTPPNYGHDGSLPLVLVFHGGGGNPENGREMTGFNDVADKYGFLVAYPAGTGITNDKLLTWNAGRCCGKAMKKQVDDVGFVSQVIDDIDAKYHIDKKRVYATGMSNGSMMSYRLGCELSDKLAAIAPVAGQAVVDGCKPKRAVATFHIHGTADQCARYEGGEQCGNCFAHFLGSFGIPMKQDVWACDSVQSQIEQTAKRNGCRSTRRVINKVGYVTCEAFEGCPKNAEVQICTVEGGGHAWPGGALSQFCIHSPGGKACANWKEQIGYTEPNFRASEEIWKFFEAHSLP